MNILHYTLGLPPYRSGGLTKYATDLMIGQSANGDVVSLLYTGDYTFWKKPKTYIVKNKIYDGVAVYEIKNPLIVPLLHGVRSPIDIYEPKQHLSKKALELFYNEVQPEIMHIHTLMGLPIDLVVYLKEKGVKIVFTSHDYYGLCLKVNFINQDGLFCKTPIGIQCAICNNDAPGSFFLRLRNSKYLLKYKDKFAARTFKTTASEVKLKKQFTLTQERSNEYSILLSYYHKLFDFVDFFHFNSTITKSVYENYIVFKNSKVISISHSGIKDFRKIKTFDKKHIHLAFIGSTTSYKGFPILKDALCDLNKNGFQKWSLDVWGSSIGVDGDCDKIIYRGKYSSVSHSAVYDDIDLLVVPSLWKETFSFITLEALSHGVPVLASSNVGAKDIVKQYNPDFIFSPTKEDLYSMLQSIMSNIKLIVDYNELICIKDFDHSFDNHILKMKQLYLNLFLIK